MKRSQMIFLLVLFGGLSTLSGLGIRPLWNPTEPRYAGLTHDVAVNGNYLTPHYEGEIYDQKPPILFWLAAAGLDTDGPRDAQARFWVRLPSAIGTILLGLIVFALAELLWNRRVGLVAAGFLYTTWLPFWSGRFLHLDTLMTAAIAGLFLAVLKMRYHPAQKSWPIIAASCLCLGLLLKGPGILAFAVLPLLIFFGTKQQRAEFPFRKFAAVLGVGVLGALAWFFAAWRAAGDEWAYEIFMREGLGRLFDSSHVAKHSRFYYFSVLFTACGPWSILLPFALVSGFMRPRDDKDQVAIKLVTTWITVIFVTLLLGSSPRSRYLMVIIPGVSLLVGRLFVFDILGSTAQALRAPTYGFRMIVGVLTTAISGACTFIIAAQFFDFRFAAETLNILSNEISQHLGAAIVACIAISLCIFALRALIMNHNARALVGTMTALLCLALIWSHWGVLAVDRIHRAEDLRYEVDAYLAQGRKLVVLGNDAKKESTFGRFLFNNRVPLLALAASPDAIQELDPQEKWLILVASREQKRHPELSQAKMVLAHPEPLGRHKYWIYLKGGVSEDHVKRDRAHDR